MSIGCECSFAGTRDLTHLKHMVASSWLHTAQFSLHATQAPLASRPKPCKGGAARGSGEMAAASAQTWQGGSTCSHTTPAAAHTLVHSAFTCALLDSTLKPARCSSSHLGALLAEAVDGTAAAHGAAPATSRAVFGGALGARAVGFEVEGVGAVVGAPGMTERRELHQLSSMGQVVAINHRPCRPALPSRAAHSVHWAGLVMAQRKQLVAVLHVCGGWLGAQVGC